MGLWAEGLMLLMPRNVCMYEGGAACKRPGGAKRQMEAFRGRGTGASSADHLCLPANVFNWPGA